jgi:hypothetical protein
VSVVESELFARAADGETLVAKMTVTIAIVALARVGRIKDGA